MIKNVLFAILQFILFLAVFLGGSLVPPFHLEHVLGVTPEGTRIFVLDGVVMIIFESGAASTPITVR